MMQRALLEIFKMCFLEQDFLPRLTSDLKESLGKKDSPYRKFHKKDTFENNNKEGQNKEELRRKILCFTCFQPWTPRHKCAKGKSQYIEVFSDNDEYEGGTDEEGHISDQ